MTVIDSYPESNYDTNATNLTTVNSAHGQVITIGPNDVNLENIQFYARRAATSLYNFTVKARIYAATGTIGTNSVGTGSMIAESTTTIDGIDLHQTTIALKTFEFSNVVLQANTSYAIVLALASRVDGSPVVGYDNSSPTHYGNRVYFSGGSWTPYEASDLIFYLNGTVAVSAGSVVKTSATGVILTSSGAVKLST